ncbi:hypothetical protein JKP88DRAFT_315688 [Tribonema minus]|uniref:Uncharacterized protein n=1 Tax=Tribonema minus TaxID=303371 RepID=A0A836CFX0_9STRA|nr:hypothetical protein JKP88DRAFT_315688 [Tribonema minus]
MPPKPKRQLLTKDEIAAARKQRKNDTTVDNCRNRLLKAFGRRAVQKTTGDNAELYSESQDREELFLRAFERQRGKELDVRYRVVTIGLKAVVADVREKADILDKLSELTSYFSRLRVYASLFSQFVITQSLNAQGQVMRTIDAAFFRSCFDAFCYPSQSNPLSQQFSQFKSLTGIGSLQAPPNTKEIKNDQAKKLWTATMTRMKEHYQKRVKAIANWVFRDVIRPHHSDMADKIFSGKVQQLIAFMSRGPSSAADVVAALIGLGFDDIIYRLDIITFCERARAVDGVTEQIRHWFNLQREYIDEPRRRFEMVIRAANTLHPGKQGKQGRKKFIDTNFTRKAPPKIVAPLPYANPRAVFIRIDKSTMKGLFPSLNIEMGPWGYRSFLSPYNKKANIRCLRCSTRGSSERSMMEAIANPDVTECPWMVAPTFETDGHQIKLSLMTSHGTNPGPPGLRYLHEAGYKLRTKNEGIMDVVGRGRGVYNDHGIIFGEDRTVLDDAMLGGVDPGVCKPLCNIYALGADWDPTAALQHRPAFNYVVVTEEEVKKLSGRKKTAHQEAVVRAQQPKYASALRTVWRYRKRTSDVSELVRYCIAWKRVEHGYWAEKLRKVRKVKAFERFRALQSQAQHIKKVVFSGFQGADKRLIVFGNGSFKAKKGHVSVPRKMIIRACACECSVVMGDERGSSKYCPCGQELVNLNREKSGKRIRVCNNTLCPLTTFDRDDGGVAGIMKTFFARFTRRRRRQADTAYDTDDESSDEEE